MTPLLYVEMALATLSGLRGEAWAKAFVEQRMNFHRQCSNGYVFSTRFGSDFFTEAKTYLLNNKLLTPEHGGTVLGEYDKNFNEWLNTLERIIYETNVARTFPRVF